MVTQDMFTHAWALALLAACWTAETKPVEQPSKPDVKPPTGEEREAIVRIDEQPGAKRFQGVWLEFAPDRRWVIDYRARELWKSFVNREVIVTGQCYRPFGQAISSTHFRVDRMRFVKPERGRGPILELGPEHLLRGKFGERKYAPGSKRADSPDPAFIDDAGKTFVIAGASESIPALGTPARVLVREVIPDMSWMAQGDGDKIWLLDVRRPDAADETEHAPTIVPCP